MLDPSTEISGSSTVCAGGAVWLITRRRASRSENNLASIRARDARRILVDSSPFLDKFYRLMSDLDVRCGGRRQLMRCDGRMSRPQRGVYFFFEGGESREDGKTPRVVRVGTHALRPSRSTLWGRLAQHRGTVAGQYARGGNHRGSVFRLHVGTALLETDEWTEVIHRTWGIGSSADSETRVIEYPLEKAVSDRIGRMSLLWLDVDDPPSLSSDRGIIERGAIALLSNHERPSNDVQSAGRLGAYASSPAIRSSGLWNVNHVAETDEGGFLAVMEAHISRMS